jgi:hypothetical protein
MNCDILNEQSLLELVDIVGRWHRNLFVRSSRWKWLGIFINHSQRSFHIRNQQTVIVNSVMMGSKTLALVVCWVLWKAPVNKTNFPSTCDVNSHFGAVKVHENEHQRIAVNAIAYPSNSAGANSWQNWRTHNPTCSPTTMVEIPKLGETLNQSC